MKNKKFEIKGTRVSIPEGVFSKLYRFSGVNKAVVFNTPCESFAMVDGELAGIWQAVFDDKGHINRGCSYLAKYQHFDEKESRSALYGFIAQLEKSLLKPSNTSVDEMLGFMREHHVLYSLGVELTYRCNERCRHCYCPPGEKEREISTKTFKRLIDEFEDLGGFVLALTGGEILVRDDIEDIFKALIGRNIVIDILSNLTLLDERKLDLIRAIKPRMVGVTIHSAVPEVHDSITNVKGSFARTISSIKKLRDKGIPVLIKTVFFNKTVNGYIGLKKLAADLDCNFNVAFDIMPKFDGSDDNSALRLTDKERLIRIFSDVDRLATKKLVAGKKRRYISGAGQQGLVVSPYGDVKPSIPLDKIIGKYPDLSLAEMWNGALLKKAVSELRIENFKKCSKCPYLSVCDVCVGSWQEKNIPDSYTCFLTELRYKDWI